jgi:hypothetical protein
VGERMLRLTHQHLLQRLHGVVITPLQHLRPREQRLRLKAARRQGQCLQEGGLGADRIIA